MTTTTDAPPLIIEIGPRSRALADAAHRLCGAYKWLAVHGIAGEGTGGWPSVAAAEQALLDQARTFEVSA